MEWNLINHFRLIWSLLMPLIAVENILCSQKVHTTSLKRDTLGEKWCSECGPDCKVDIYFEQVCLLNSDCVKF